MKTAGKKGYGTCRAFCVFLFLMAAAHHALGQEAALVPERPEPMPIVFDGQTVAIVYSAASVATIEERVAAILDRLNKVAQNRQIAAESIQVTELEGVVVVGAGRIGIMAVTQGDAAAAERPREELAQAFAENMRTAVRQYRERRSWDYLLLGILKAVGGTILFAALMIGYIKLRRKVRQLILSRIQQRLETVQPESTKHTLVTQSARILLALLEIFNWALAFLSLWIFTVLVLSFFPGTAGIANAIFGWIFSPIVNLAKAFVGYIPSLFIIVVISIVTNYLIQLSRFVFGEIREGRIAFPRFYPEWADPTHSLVRSLLLVLAAIVAFPYLPGSDSPAFKGISIFLGVLLSLGSSSAVSNMVAGVILTYMREFKVGDRVRIGDTEGDVIEKSLLVTRVRTIKNVEVNIPNGTLLNAYVANFSVAAQQKNLILHTSVTIGYDAPWRQIHAMLKQAAARTPCILEHPAPFILQTSLDDFYVTYELNAYTDQAYEMPFTYSHLHKNIQDIFNEYGVQIMSPHYLGDKAQPAVVPRNQWYVPPAKPPGDPEADQ
jgi:small-conductance mechanosensitive channel